MRARLDALLARLGVAGVLGIGVLIACAAFHAGTLLPAQRELAAQRAALERLRARGPFQPLAADRLAGELERFRGLFPPVEALGGQVELLHRLARNSGLELAQGEYRLERRATGLWAYRVSLPARGTYPQVRGFVAAALEALPTASLDALRFERKRANERLLDTQIRLTLHVRPTGDSP